MRDFVFERLRDSLKDRYELQRQLGEGGAAIVYLGRELRHDRLVAVKKLRYFFEQSTTAQRFLKEIHYLARLLHPAFPPLLDSGSVDGQPFFVTPFYPEVLQERLRAARRGLPINLALRIGEEIAEALDYAHRQNVVHRDVKPLNIFLADDHAVLADFGIARAMIVTGIESGEPGITETGMAIGTPAYMSPEQLRGEKELDGRSDQYNLACSVYELLTGEPPFMGPRGVVDNARKFTELPPPPSRLREGLPALLDQVLLRALGRYPHERYETAREFGRALQSAACAVGH